MTLSLFHKRQEDNWKEAIAIKGKMSPGKLIIILLGYHSFLSKRTSTPRPYPRPLFIHPRTRAPHQSIYYKSQRNDIRKKKSHTLGVNTSISTSSPHLILQM